MVADKPKSKKLQKSELKLQSSEKNLQPGNNLILQFTNEEMSYVSYLNQLFNETSFSQFYLLFSQDTNILQTWFCAAFHGNIIPFEVIQKLEWSDNIAFTEIGLLLLSLENLTDYENATLVQRNVPKITAFLWIVATDLEDIAVCFQQFIAYGQQHPDSDGVATILPILQQFQVSNISNDDRYNNVFSSPWAPHIDIEDQHHQITQAIKRWARSGTAKGYDQIQSVLLSIIIFLSCEDEMSLERQQKAKIEKLQMKYILLYQRYLKSSYPREANAKFVGGLMLLHYSKELCKMHSLRLPI